MSIIATKRSIVGTRTVEIPPPEDSGNTPDFDLDNFRPQPIVSNFDTFPVDSGDTPDFRVENFS